jgi:hypothetical protein
MNRAAALKRARELIGPRAELRLRHPHRGPRLCRVGKVWRFPYDLPQGIEFEELAQGTSWTECLDVLERKVRGCAVRLLSHEVTLLLAHDAFPPYLRRQLLLYLEQQREQESHDRPHEW